MAVQSTTTSPAVRVPYVDLVGQHRPLKAELREAIAEVIDTGQYILGPAVTEFETRFAQVCGVRAAVGVGNGTDALVLTLRVLGVTPGAGHEVITVPNSFVATASAIALAGAKPVFVDVGDDYNMDASLLERAITPRTRAIIPVHLTGRAANMAPILEIAARHKLPVVEDAAQAVLAEYRGKRVGGLGTLGCFSLHPLKTLNACGDGGVITTNDPALADQLKTLRNIGLKTREDAVAWSGNSRLDSLQAAVLLVKLRYLEAWTNARRVHASVYRQALHGVPGVTCPGERDDERPVYHTFVIQAQRRDELQKHLLAQGIQTGIHYPVPIHLQTAARDLGYQRGSFPVAERQAERILSLPVYPELTPEQLRLVIEGIREFYGA